jgi:DNA modification methylase
MTSLPLPIDQILHGNCLDILNSLPDESVNLVFADPPYNLQLQQALWRPNLSKVSAVEEAWDQFENFQSYDEFTNAWLSACRRILKPDGALWVIGTYHNIYRIGSILQNLGYWILNDVVWIKVNPMPNFHGVRLTNAHETLIWACKTQKSRYTFNYQAMKAHNDDLQMRSDWFLPICTGPERIKQNGKKAHPTQKPEALLYRILAATTHPGDVILDPFFGTGTTGAVAKKLHRHYIGIEQDADYVSFAQKRIASISVIPYDEAIFNRALSRRNGPRISIGTLLENELLDPGQTLYFRANRDITARIRMDGHLIMGNDTGSIHQIARHLLDGSPCNGWDLWYFKSSTGDLLPISELRSLLRSQMEKTIPN